MASPNVSELATTTIEKRSKKIADNVIKNNAALAYLRKGGNVKSFAGGTKIYEELSYTANTNGGAYSGYDLLPVAAQDVLSAAEFSMKQYAVPVVMSGLEELQNSGAEQMIDLLAARIKNAESTMANLVAEGIYGDGTGTGGKVITGLDAAVPVTATGEPDQHLRRHQPLHLELLAFLRHRRRVVLVHHDPGRDEHDLGEPVPGQQRSPAWSSLTTSCGATTSPASRASSGSPTRRAPTWASRP